MTVVSLIDAIDPGLPFPGHDILDYLYNEWHDCLRGDLSGQAFWWRSDWALVPGDVNQSTIDGRGFCTRKIETRLDLAYIT